jgi:hypothetical protein
MDRHCRVVLVEAGMVAGRRGRLVLACEEAPWRLEPDSGKAILLHLFMSTRGVSDFLFLSALGGMLMVDQHELQDVLCMISGLSITKWEARLATSLNYALSLVSSSFTAWVDHVIGCQ